MTLPIQDHGFSANVPVFNCIVYVSTRDGQSFGRVANLAGIEATGNSERDVLAQLIPAFKQYVAAKHAEQQAIEWIDPPAPIAAGEQQRLVPVHL